MHLALEKSRELKCTTLQVFVKNQRQWAAPPVREEQVAAWRAAYPGGDFGPVVAHASYLINIASPDDALWIKSRDALADELERCAAFGIPYLVLHPGAAMGAVVDVALQRVVRALDDIFGARPGLPTMPLLETTAGQGSALGRSFAELGAILHGLREPGRVGACIDTCHVFSAGYDIRSPNGYDAMMAEADREVGLERIRCWHLNDSRAELGAHVDRHEHIGKGKIGTAGFRNVLADRRFIGVPMILETPKNDGGDGDELDVMNLARLRRISAAVGRERAAL